MSVMTVIVRMYLKKMKKEGNMQKNQIPWSAIHSFLFSSFYFTCCHWLEHSKSSIFRDLRSIVNQNGFTYLYTQVFTATINCYPCCSDAYDCNSAKRVFYLFSGFLRNVRRASLIFRKLDKYLDILSKNSFMGSSVSVLAVSILSFVTKCGASYLTDSAVDCAYSIIILPIFVSRIRIACLKPLSHSYFWKLAEI